MRNPRQPGSAPSGEDMDEDAPRNRLAPNKVPSGGLLDSPGFAWDKFSDIVLDPVLTTDPHGVITDVNRPMEALMGRIRGELIGSRFEAHFAEPARAAAFLDLVLIARRVTGHELTARTPAGTECQVSFQAKTFGEGDGKVRGVFTVARDITDLKRAEDLADHVRRELNCVRAALDEHAIVSITDPAGRITYVNDNFCAISQYTREDLLGRDHRIINSGFHDQQFIRGIWRTLAEGGTWRGEIMNKAEDGSIYWVDTTIVPRLDQRAKPIQFIAMQADITARKTFERALREANRKKSEFLANMSHELRTPLNGIIGFTEFLIDEKPGPLRPKQKEYLGDVLKSACHLLQLINDVLDLAKVEAGKMELHPERFSLHNALEEVVAVVKGIAGKKRIAVGLEIGAGFDTVTLDQHKFKQVLYNLLSNAVKFSDEGGQVGVVARRLEGGLLQLSVHDHGIGIQPGDLHRLFTEFEQLDSGTARRFEGTGLGLALSKKIVEFQGGTIGVESTVGQGSVFTVILPVMPRAGAAA